MYVLLKAAAMSRLLLLGAVLTALLNLSVTAQPLQLQLVINPNPSAYLSDWQTRSETVFLSVTNATSGSFLVRVNASVKKGTQSGSVVAETKTEQMQPIEIPPGVTILNAEDVFQYDLVRFYGNIDKISTRTGRLPSGLYTICISLVDARSSELALTNDVCAQFSVQEVLPPRLIAPQNNAELSPELLPSAVFHWSRETPPVTGTHAEVVVVEYRDGQPAWQALESNPIVFRDRASEGSTGLPWPPDIQLFEGRRYVWSVRILDEQDRPVTQPPWAEPFLFSVVSDRMVANCNCNNLRIVTSVDNKETQPNERTEAVPETVHATKSVTPAFRTLSGQPIELNYITDCQPACIKDVAWEVQYVGSAEDGTGNSDASASPIPPGAIVQAGTGASLIFLNTPSGTYQVLCRITKAPSSITARLSETNTLVATATVVVQAGETPVQSRDTVPCSISVVEPLLPCTGTVKDYHTSGAITVTYAVSGNVTDATITITDNPCGKWIPPGIPRVPTETTTPSPSARLPVPSAAGVHSVTIPIMEYVEPGAAYIIRINGRCTSPAGLTADVVSDDVCWRYRPLTESPETNTEPPASDRTTETRPGSGDVTETPVPRVPGIPVPERPCDSIPPTVVQCNPTRGTNPATPIQATLELKDADLYKYPRATPLRVNAVDWDYAIFTCEGCGGGDAQKWIPVRDGISTITWKLTGKGSLNSPFSSTAIGAVDSKLNDLLQRLKDITDSLKQIPISRQKAIDEFKRIQDNAQKQLATANDDLRHTRDSLSVTEQQLSALADSLSACSKRLQHISENSRELFEQVRRAQDSVARYDSLLINRPGPEELSRLITLEKTQSAVNKAKATLNSIQQEIVSQTKVLQASIRTTELLLARAQKTYSDLVNTSGRHTRNIANFQQQLYHSPELRSYHGSVRDLRRYLTLYAAQFPAALNLAVNTSRIENMISTVHEALTRGSTPRQRSQARSYVDSLYPITRASLLLSCSVISDSVQRTSCSTAAGNVTGALDAFVTIAITCIDGGQTMPRGVEQKIQSERTSMLSFEAALASAYASVEVASAQHSKALQAYSDKMESLDASRVNTVNEVEQATVALAETQQLYDQERNSRDSLFKAMQPQLLNQRAHHSAVRDSVRRMIDSNAVSFTKAIADSIAVNLQNDSALARKQDLTIREAGLKQTIARLKELLKKTEADVRKPFDNLEAALRADSIRIEKEIAEALKTREQLSGGNKAAEGEFAYYIPPPLEILMNDGEKKEFQRLKDSVAVAEAAVTIALTAKEALQAELTGMLVSISAALAEIKQLVYQQSEAEDAIKELNSKIADDKNNLALDFRETYDKLQEIIGKAQKLEQDAGYGLEVKISEATRKARELETKKAEFDKVVLELYTASVDANNTIEDARTKALAARQTINSLNDASLTQHENRQQLKSVARERSRANDQTRRAIAQESAAAETAAKAAELSANAKYQNKVSEIAAQQTILNTLNTLFEKEINNMAAADSLVSKAQKEWLRVYNTYQKKHAAYMEAFNSLEATVQEIEAIRGIRDRASAKAMNAQTAQENLPDQDDVIDNNSDIKASQAERDTKQKLVETIKKKIDALSTEISGILSSKELKTKSAQEHLENARKNLQQKNADLRSFVLTRFNSPKNIDTLEITVADKVVDAFRSKDGVSKFICYVRYDGSRTPMVQCSPFNENKPPVKTTAGPCIPKVEPLPDAPITGTDPHIEKFEPRTIALLYKNGEPIWPEWPVFESGLLAKDVVVLQGAAADNDVFIHKCLPSDAWCIRPPPKRLSVVDLPHRQWSGKGMFRHILPRSERVLWEPEHVEKPVCKEPQETKADYTAPEIAPDPEVPKKAKHIVKAAVLIEVTDSLTGWPKHTDTVIARLVTGDHKGLGGERIILKPHLEQGESKDWSLNGVQDVVEVTTDANGYIKVPFDFGDGFASWKIKLSWVRTDTCERRTIHVISPLLLKFHRFNKSAPTIAWDAAVKVWEGSSVHSVLDEMPDVTEHDNPYGKMVHSVAGLLDHNRDFVNDETINFKPLAPKFTTVPDNAITGLFGIARSQVKDTIEKAVLKMQVFPSDTLKPLSRPPAITKEYNPKGGKTFSIGASDDLFVVEMNELFDPQDVVTGEGTLKINNPNEFLRSLVDIPVTAEGIVLNGSLVATEGTVRHESGELQASWDAFSFAITSVEIQAGIGCAIEGSVSHSKIETPVVFTAALSTNGEFYGRIENLPSVTAAGFTVKQGASVALDFHSKFPANDPLGADFRGIAIGKAEVEFPDEFTSKDGGIPTVLSVSDFGFGSSGLSGKISVEGGPLSMSFSKFSISVSKLTVVFEKNSIKEGSIEGAFSLEKPLSGTLETKLTWSDTWKAEFETKSSLSIPRWKAVVAILPGTQLEYDPQSGIGMFTLVSTIQSDRFGTIRINELILGSDGTFKIDGGIEKDINIKILSGLDLKITNIKIEATGDDFKLAIDGGIGIPGIGLQQTSGTLYVLPGPEFSIKFNSADITITKGPFTLTGKFEWTDNSIYAKLKVEITNVLSGIEGEIMVGTQPTSDNKTYTFWYVGLTVSTAIPLGQSGLSITSIGGGIGWNCRPPAGSGKPTPEFFDNIALRASVGVGNTLPPPAGKVFNSEFVMVYTPGSITLNGQAWLMNQRSSILGEGELTLAWSPNTLVSGFLRASVGIPDNEGKFLRIQGKVDFKFSPSEFVIKSEYLDASLMGIINANAQFEVTKPKGFIRGTLSYNVNKEANIVIGTVKAGINLSATAELAYTTEPSVSVSGSASFRGNAYLTFENWLTSFDIARMNAVCNASFSTTGSTFTMNGSVDLYVSVLSFGGNVNFDVGVSV